MQEEKYEQKFVNKKYLTAMESCCMITKVIANGKICRADFAV